MEVGFQLTSRCRILKHTLPPTHHTSALRWTVYVNHNQFKNIQCPNTIRTKFQIKLSFWTNPPTIFLPSIIQNPANFAPAWLIVPSLQTKRRTNKNPWWTIQDQRFKKMSIKSIILPWRYQNTLSTNFSTTVFFSPNFRLFWIIKTHHFSYISFVLSFKLFYSSNTLILKGFGLFLVSEHIFSYYKHPISIRSFFSIY